MTEMRNDMMRASPDPEKQAAILRTWARNCHRAQSGPETGDEDQGDEKLIALIQRVSTASVTVDGGVVGAIDRGILALIGVETGDDASIGERLLERVLGYRIFEDRDGRMNLSLRDVAGGLLLVPQFTLAADTRKGTRPGFSTAATPEAAREAFAQLLAAARARHSPVASGEFGAHMRVALVNDGPVTFWLRTNNKRRDKELTDSDPA
jgi:D-tyrosyl-tRNA(Tyr) deacylase